MPPLADIHCHLLAGLDDGPRTWDDAVEMCRIAAADGIRRAAATAHQNERWSAVTPDAIRAAARELNERLRSERVALEVFPSAEVMADPDLETAWEAGRLLGVGGHTSYLLVEMPHRVFVDLRAVVERFRRRGVRVILAHPERHPELL